MSNLNAVTASVFVVTVRGDKEIDLSRPNQAFCNEWVYFFYLSGA